jgi:hypothetical protein
MGLYKSKKKQIKELKDALRIEKRFFALALDTAQQLERLNKRLISENNLFREMEAFDASLKKKTRAEKIVSPDKPKTYAKGAKVTQWTSNPRNFETPWIN